MPKECRKDWVRRRRRRRHRASVLVKGKQGPKGSTQETGKERASVAYIELGSEARECTLGSELGDPK
jgi:hypothetical protein